MVTAPMAAREEKPTHLRHAIRQPRLTGLNVSIGRRKNRTPVEDFLKKRLQSINNWRQAGAVLPLQDITATANLIRNKAKARFVSWLVAF
jgi:hypothetical protein